MANVSRSNQRGSSPSSSSLRAGETMPRARIWLFMFLMLPFIGLLIARLWWVQIKQGPDYVEDILQQSIRDIRLPAVRGKILARDGRILTDNQPSYDLVFSVGKLRRRGSTRQTIQAVLDQSRELSRLIHREQPLTEAGIRRHISWYPALPLPVFRDLNKTELTLVMETAESGDGWIVRTNYERTHPYPGTASHALGFTGTIYPPDEAELERYSYYEREPHGRAGLEKYYDDILAGKPGRKTVRVDTLGYVHEEAARAIAPENGASLILEMDVQAQTIAERLMRGHRGAFVLLDAQTGGVLAMVSVPGYDLDSLSSETYSQLASDTENRPLLNRALSPGYLPGSIVKPLVALAALEKQVLDPEETVFNCPGYFRMGNMRIHCGRRSGHGDLNLIPALAQSCNTFFIDLGQITGLEQLASTFRQAGLGESPGLDFPGGGGSGLVPSRQWARERLNREWIASDTAFISIGQGSINLSPLQAAVYIAAVANGGAVLQPRLVQAVLREDGQTVKRFTPVIRRRLNNTPEQLAIVRQGMEAVVNSDIATAPLARNPAIPIAGKTGTAEVGPRNERRKNTWFVGFAPVENPQYAFAIVVEDGQSGGKTAAPVAGKFFDTWLTTE